MQSHANEADGQLRRHRLVIVVVRVVFGLSLALLVLLIMRVPTESVPVAAARFAARHSELQALEEALRSMKPRPDGSAVPGQDQSTATLDAASLTVRQRLRTLKTARCDSSGSVAEDAVRLAELTQRASDYEALMRDLSAPGAAVSAAALMDRFHHLVLEADRGAYACMQRELDDFAAHIVQTRRQVLALVGLLMVVAAGVLWLRRDDRSRLGEQLRSSEQLIDALPLPLSLRSADGRFMLVNKAFEQKHRVARKHLLGNPVRETMPRFDADAITLMDARAKASLEAVDETFDLVTDDVPRNVQVRVQALRRADNSVMCIVGIQTDVTALRRKEAQLIEINANLSQLSMKMIDAQEDERRRIARDLHDHVGQILTALKMQLASLAMRQRIDKPADALTMPIDLAEEALRHARDISASLHPHLLDDLGLEPALNWLIDRFIRPSVPLIEIRCRLEPPRGPEETELVAFRVVQEALTNVVRHANATRVGVILETVDEMLRIEVIDDGVGFDAGETWFELQRTTSLGVTSMHDRVAEVGGDLHMDSTRGGGTSLRVHLPW